MGEKNCLWLKSLLGRLRMLFADSLIAILHLSKSVFIIISSSSYGSVSMIQVRHKERIGNQGLFFYHPRLLCCINQMLTVTELSLHLVLSSKTVRPIIPQGARCIEHVKVMWFAVGLLAPHSDLAEEARSLLCMDEPKRPMPVRRRLSLTQAVLVKLISIGLVLTLGM